MAKVSVIVPVYNVEEYLQECIESILNQTLKDIEIICVDDGSKDNCAGMLDDFARSDSRVKVIHKQNTGYGNTMNVGMRAATGEYLGIVESDDRILPDFYERLYSVAKKEDLDVVKSDALFCWEQIGYSYHLHYNALDAYYDRVLTDKERRVFYRFLMNTWTGIYRRSFLQEHDIWHNETPGASYQDNGFWMQTMSFARRMMCVREAYYCYRQDNPGASVKDVKKVMAMSNEYDYIERTLCEKHASAEVLAICNYYRLARDYGNFYRIADECKRDFCERMIQDYDKYAADVEKDAFFIPWYEKMNENPDEFCQQVIGTKNYVLDKIKNTDGIYIYGAGIRGQHVFRNLCYMNLYDKIKGFVVSGAPEQACVCTKAVKRVNEFVDSGNNMLYIVSVKRNTEAYKQMRECLEAFEIKNVLDSEDIIDNFYSICG